MLLMMSENIGRNMYSCQGTVNYPIQMHLFGHFRKYCSGNRLEGGADANSQSAPSGEEISNVGPNNSQ